MIGSARAAPSAPRLNRQAHDLESVYRVAEVLSRATDPDQVCEAALEGFLAALKAARGAILVAEDAGLMQSRASRGLDDACRNLLQSWQPWADPYGRPAPITSSEVEASAALAPLARLPQERVRSLSAVPILYGERLLGALVACWDVPHTLGALELRHGVMIAGHVGLALERHRAERSLKLYRAIFDHSSEAVSIVDTNGICLEQNAAHLSLLGYTLEEMAGKTPAEILGEEALASMMSELQRTGVFRGVVRARLRHGGTRDLDLNVFTVRDDAGAPVWFVGTKRDVTEQRRTEDALRFLAQLGTALDASLDLKVTLDNVARAGTSLLADWCWVEVVDERGTLHLSGAHADAALAPAIAELRRQCAESPGFVAEAVPTGPSLPPSVPEYLGARLAPDAERRQLFDQLGAASALVLPLRARGRSLGTVTLVLSTASRLFGPAEVALASELASRSALALSNAWLYREAQESDRRKDEFLAMLAHELRNPLAPILTSLQLMQRHSDDPGAVERDRAVIERQAHRLTRLVDDLLDVSRITRGKITLRLDTVDLATIMARAVETIRPLLDERRHRLSVSSAPLLRVRVDPLRLEQVLANLLNNAAKYTPIGGRISLTAETEQAEVVIRVRDNGIGIPALLLPRLFEPFLQGDQPDRAHGGLGIGLTLVRALVELHGGEVEATSPGPGQGSELVVRLPIAAKAEAAEAPRPPAPALVPPAPLRILVVDDNADAAVSLAEALADDGHEVSVAGDGPTALARIAALLPQVVLLDIGLPGMDGLEVARRVREQPELRGVALVAVSGYGQRQDRERSLAAGCLAHLVKPVTLELLEQTIAQVIRPNEK